MINPLKIFLFQSLEFFLIKTEIMANLVSYGLTNVFSKVMQTRANALQRFTVDDDPVRKDVPIPKSSIFFHNSMIEAQ